MAKSNERKRKIRKIRQKARIRKYEENEMKLTKITNKLMKRTFRKSK